MSLPDKAKQASEAIIAALSKHELSEAEKEAVVKVLQKMMVATVETTAKKHLEATVICCGHEADLAHKIQEEANRKTALLISNLMAMR